MIRRAFLSVLLFLAACSAAPQGDAQAQPPPPGAQQAVFAGGCFWCMEHDMQAIPGVLKVESGYTGGTLANPSYEDVLTERTGHYEAVRVTFDPDKIPYRALVDRYWRLIDPTDAGGQFCDRGPSYRSAIFAAPGQRADAEASKQALVASGKVRGEIVTPVLPLGPFYLAEPYHRDFAKRNALRYNLYRQGCGRDARLAQIWR